MDDPSLALIARLLRGQDLAALGTLRDGAPFVSMVPFVANEDFSGLIIHVSGLAQHTRNLRSDARASLLVVEPRAPHSDGQTLARLSVQGTAAELAPTGSAGDSARRAYLDRFPSAARNFALADFALFAIAPADARLVAGFGHIRDISPVELRDAARR